MGGRSGWLGAWGSRLVPHSNVRGDNRLGWVDLGPDGMFALYGVHNVHGSGDTNLFEDLKHLS
jgi:hypothetical protein